MTSEEFVTLKVDDYSDHYRFELIEGELSVREPAAPPHGSALWNIVRILGNYVHDHKLGTLYLNDTNVYIDPETIRAADVAFVSKEHLPLKDQRWLLEPDLAIEMLSPGNRPGYMAKKLSHYLSVRTRLVWYIDPRRRQIDVYRADGSTEVLLPSSTLSGENVIEGFSCPVWEILDT